MSANKIPKCVECEKPLKHVQNNQWMCQQSLNMCKNSTRVIFVENENKT